MVGFKLNNIKKNTYIVVMTYYRLSLLKITNMKIVSLRNFSDVKEIDIIIALLLLFSIRSV